MIQPSKKTLDFRNKVLLFDFDGTIVETETLAKRVIDGYFREKGFPGDLPFAELIVGRTWEVATETMVEFAQKHGLSVPSAKELHREFQVRYRKEISGGVRLIPGVIEKLTQLKSIARTMALVTGSEPEEVKLIFEAHGLTHFFDRIWAFGDYSCSKPDPAPFLAALKHYQVSADEALAFEDSVAGMESAKRAGLEWVQVAFEEHSLKPHPESLQVIRHWDELEIG